MESSEMAVPFLDLKAQYRGIRSRVDAALAEVVESQRFVLGEPVERLEREVASRVGARHGIGCASGTDALLLALKALDLEPGDEVVVPSFTFFATAGAVWNAGLRPVFADIDPGTYNLGDDTVEAALTERTRAVIVVHLYGRMAPMAPLMRLARERGIAVIEDAAQAFGAEQRIDGEWRAAGSIGAIGCFSFFPTKILGGFGDGGMVVTDDDGIADRVSKLRVHGGRQMYHHELVGTNSRLDALQAAVLNEKLPHVSDWLARRRGVAGRYGEGLSSLGPEVQTPGAGSSDRHAWNVYTIRVPRRDALKQHLDANEIGNSIYYPVPLHLQPCFETLGQRRGSLPASEQAADEVLSLPIFPEMSADQVDRVVDSVTLWYSSSIKAG